MRVHKSSIALGMVIAALATTAPVSASAQWFDGHSTADSYTFNSARASRPSGRVVRGGDLSAAVSDAPEGLRPKRRDVSDHDLNLIQTYRGTSRPSRNDMRVAPFRNPNSFLYRGMGGGGRGMGRRR
jgi:hypothetical protein